MKGRRKPRKKRPNPSDVEDDDGFPDAVGDSDDSDSPRKGRPNEPRKHEKEGKTAKKRQKPALGDKFHGDDDFPGENEYPVQSGHPDDDFEDGPKIKDRRRPKKPRKKIPKSPHSHGDVPQIGRGGPPSLADQIPKPATLRDPESLATATRRVPTLQDPESMLT
eukprot:UN28494